MTIPFYFTGRKKINQSDISISIWDAPDEVPTARIELKLSHYGLPSDALVSVDAYTTTYYQPISLGRIADISSPVVRRLDGMSKGDRPRFRVKVTERANGKLLAANDRVTASLNGDEKGERHSLLEVEWKSNEEMGGEFWRVGEQDYTIFLNKDAPNFMMLAHQHDAFFEGMIYPSVLRRIMTIEFLQDINHLDRESEWYQFAISIVHDEAPDRDSFPDVDIYRSEIEGWIDRVVREFCRKQRFMERLIEANEPGTWGFTS